MTQSTKSREWSQHFGGTCCLRLQGRSMKMEATVSFEILITICHTWCRHLEDHSHIHHLFLSNSNTQAFSATNADYRQMTELRALAEHTNFQSFSSK
jgi:hypothetical protein